MRPILLNSCARAATTVEARFRIDAPIAPSRGARVIALDDPAAALLATVAGQSWASARFYRTAGPERLHGIGPGTTGAEEVSGLYALEPELAGVDVAVMVATSPAGAAGAASIGAACAARQIMTAGLALVPEEDERATLAILRPHARVLLVSSDAEDVAALLTALRA